MTGAALVEEARRIQALMLPGVEAVLVLMKSEGIRDPVAVLRDLLARAPDAEVDALALRYGPHARALRVVFLLDSNGPAVERALAQALALAGALL